MDDQNIRTLKAIQNTTAQILTDYLHSIENISFFVLRKHEIINICFPHWLAHVITPSLTTLTGFMEYMDMKILKGVTISPEDIEKLNSHHIAYKTALSFFLSFSKIPDTSMITSSYKGTKDNPVPYPELSRQFFHELFFSSENKESNIKLTQETAKLLEENFIILEKKIYSYSS